MESQNKPTWIDVGWGKVEKKPPDPDEVLGENPGDIPIVGVMDIGQVGDEDEFPGLVSDYLDENPDVLADAKANEEDVTARMDKAKKVALFIGKGAAVLAAGVGALTIAFVVYKSRKDKKMDEE